MVTVDTVVVTGATAGVGLACARQLIEQGSQVIGIGRRKARLAQLQQELGPRFLPIACDLRHLDEARALLLDLPAPFRAVTTLVNNAGLLQGQGPLLEVRPVQIATMLDTNIAALVNVTQALLPALIASGRGHIVNLSSIAASHHYAGGHVYAASKAFVEHFGRCLRAELTGTKVRLTNVAPGKTRSEFALVQHEGDHARAEQVYSTLTPLEPDDVARSVLWALAQPPHVNISHIELVPADQSLFYR
jgi:NADP-dependent 3-hydroxy acid dehydrogenase YdfG